MDILVNVVLVTAKAGITQQVWVLTLLIVLTAMASKQDDVGIVMELVIPQRPNVCMNNVNEHPQTLFADACFTHTHLPALAMAGRHLPTGKQG